MRKKILLIGSGYSSKRIRVILLSIYMDSICYQYDLKVVIELKHMYIKIDPGLHKVIV